MGHAAVFAPTAAGGLKSPARLDGDTDCLLGDREYVFRLEVVEDKVPAVRGKKASPLLSSSFSYFRGLKHRV